MRSFSDFLSTALVILSTSANAAVIDPPSNILLTDLAASNTSLPSNQTISPPPSNLPPSPYIYPIPTAPTTTVTFSSYTHPLSELSAIQCILAATEDVAVALEAALRDHDPDRVVRQRYVRIDAEHAWLIMEPIEMQMTWVTWGQTLKALREFLYRWEFVGFRFVVEEEGVTVAVGELSGR
ncbi:MAG: hypothetical protein Q9161_000619 [Pseudevernia consocians]